VNFAEDCLKEVESLLEFTRCQRPDGSYYGTSGQCRKGTEVEGLKKLKVGVVQGRFNLSHAGHAKLIARVLLRAEKVHVVVTTQKGGDRPGGVSGKGGNLDWNFRKLMLSRALKAEGVDMSRVKFVKANSAVPELERLAKENGPQSVGIFLGKDPENGKFAKSISKSLGTKGGFLPAEGGNMSSSKIRKAIDDKNEESLDEMFPEDNYMKRLALLGRSLELADSFVQHIPA
jgi:FAD synthase